MACSGGPRRGKGPGSNSTSRREGLAALERRTGELAHEVGPAPRSQHDRRRATQRLAKEVSAGCPPGVPKFTIGGDHKLADPRRSRHTPSWRQAAGRCRWRRCGRGSGFVTHTGGMTVLPLARASGGEQSRVMCPWRWCWLLRENKRLAPRWCSADRLAGRRLGCGRSGGGGAVAPPGHRGHHLPGSPPMPCGLDGAAHRARLVPAVCGADQRGSGWRAVVAW